VTARAAALAIILGIAAPARGDRKAPPLTREGVATHLRERLEDVKGCYQKAAARKPWLVGRVVVSFTIDGEGRVSRVELERAELDDARFLVCARDVVASWRFERASGEPMDFSYPIVFAGGKGDASVLVDGRPRPAVLPARCQHPAECRSLGASLEYGANADASRSFEYFRTGCELEDGASCLGAAEALDSGHGIAKDKRRAFELARRACALGDQRGCTMVAMTYALGGEGVARDPAKATVILERACKAGAPAACLNLAERLRLGLGAPRDEARARALREQVLARAD
jgi:TonB family protein